MQRNANNDKTIENTDKPVVSGVVIFAYKIVSYSNGIENSDNRMRIIVPSMLDCLAE